MGANLLWFLIAFMVDGQRLALVPCVNDNSSSLRQGPLIIRTEVLYKIEFIGSRNGILVLDLIIEEIRVRTVPFLEYARFALTTRSYDPTAAPQDS